MKDRGKIVGGLPGGAGYAELAAEFIAEAERIAALGLPTLPEDPAEAAAMRRAGYDVLAECTGLAGASAIVCVASEDEDLGQKIPAGDLAAALDVPAVAMLPGTEFLAVLRETPEDGRVWSGFRRVPGGEITAVRKTA
jgi:hypothetical protein